MSNVASAGDSLTCFQTYAKILLLWISFLFIPFCNLRISDWCLVGGGPQRFGCCLRCPSYWACVCIDCACCIRNRGFMISWNTIENGHHLDLDTEQKWIHSNSVTAAASPAATSTQYLVWSHWNRSLSSLKARWLLSSTWAGRFQRRCFAFPVHFSERAGNCCISFCLSWLHSVSVFEYTDFWNISAKRHPVSSSSKSLDWDTS